MPRPICPVCKKNEVFADHHGSNAKRKYCTEECASIAGACKGLDRAHEVWREVHRIDGAFEAFTRPRGAS